MGISKTKNYLVLNYNPSPVAVRTKHESFLVPGGTQESPGTLPFTIDEISAINSNSVAFKIGLLRFEERDQTDIYAELRLDGWKDILTDKEIEDFLLNPTLEGLQKIIDIQNDAYFERVRGVFSGLKSAGADLSTKVETVITKRYKELMDHKRASEIRLTPVSDKKETDATKAELEAMRAQMAQMQDMLAKLQAQPPKQDGTTPPKKGSAKAKTSDGE